MTHDLVHPLAALTEHMGEVPLELVLGERIGQLVFSSVSPPADEPSGEVPLSCGPGVLSSPRRRGDWGSQSDAASR